MSVTVKWIEEQIESVKTCDDPSIKVYMVRDTPEVESAGLKDLAWAFHKGNPVRSEVVCFLETLRDYLVNETQIQSAFDRLESVQLIDNTFRDARDAKEEIKKIIRDLAQEIKNKK